MPRTSHFVKRCSATHKRRSQWREADVQPALMRTMLLEATLPFNGRKIPKPRSEIDRASRSFAGIPLTFRSR
ncbi:hypothetical protein LMG28614_06770 [Paraburkholderia ultramafica]|uniref:Uncharacterized protein n=1 Tax=Paraburkholderia ultramafica TaxID=1544867 RepID=A0A6S7DI50_9BURK|nr:hypothetical protein LMG28614_06770 [Paraburkholderia ultramafica]